MAAEVASGDGAAPCSAPQPGGSEPSRPRAALPGPMGLRTIVVFLSTVSLWCQRDRHGVVVLDAEHVVTQTGKRVGGLSLQIALAEPTLPPTHSQSPGALRTIQDGGAQGRRRPRGSSLIQGLPLPLPLTSDAPGVWTEVPLLGMDVRQPTWAWSHDGGPCCLCCSPSGVWPVLDPCTFVGWPVSACRGWGRRRRPEWSPVWSPHTLGLNGGKGTSTQHGGPSLSPEKAAVGLVGGEGLERSRPRASEHVSRASTHGNLPMKQEGPEAKKPHNKVLLLKR